jgi:Acyclic terpene utilisation family protein AtuA
MGVRIGCATAWSGDRFEPADVLVQRGDLDYLFFEAMSETTMSLAQIKLARDASLPGWDP